MAKEVNPTREYLERFSKPLWDLMDFEGCKPLKIIEGQRDKYPFIIIDMQHDAYGPLSGDQRTAVSTFFIVNHCKDFAHPSFAQRSRRYQISVDNDYAYLVSPSKQVRPGDWEYILKILMKMADSLIDSPSDSANRSARLKTYHPVGMGVFTHAFWAIVCLIVAILLLAYGLGGILGIEAIKPAGNEPVKEGFKYLLASAMAFWGVGYYLKRMKKRL